MAQYLVESKHTKETCVEALDALKEKSSDLLKKTWFGCMAGKHIGWTTLKANDEKEVKEMFPESLRGSAEIIKVDMFTPAQIESFHK